MRSARDADGNIVDQATYNNLLKKLADQSAAINALEARLRPREAEKPVLSPEAGIQDILDADDADASLVAETRIDDLSRERDFLINDNAALRACLKRKKYLETCTELKLRKRQKITCEWYETMQRISSHIDPDLLSLEDGSLIVPAIV